MPPSLYSSRSFMILKSCFKMSATRSTFLLGGGGPDLGISKRSRELTASSRRWLQEGFVRVCLCWAQDSKRSSPYCVSSRVNSLFIKASRPANLSLGLLSDFNHAEEGYTRSFLMIRTNVFKTFRPPRRGLSLPLLAVVRVLCSLIVHHLTDDFAQYLFAV